MFNQSDTKIQDGTNHYMLSSDPPGEITLDMQVGSISETDSGGVQIAFKGYPFGRSDIGYVKETTVTLNSDMLYIITSIIKKKMNKE